MSNLTTIPLTGLSNTVQDLLNQTIDLSGVSNTAVLFNDSNTANGSAALTFDKASNTLTVTGNILPGANITYDLGSADKRFKDLYLANNTVYLGNASISSSGNGIVLPASVAIGDSVITAANGGISLPEGSSVGGVSIASPKISNVQVTDSSWNVLDDTAVDTAGGYVIINGSGFASGVNVLIGTTTATSVTRQSATQLRVQVPALGSNSYTVYATNPDGGVAIGLNAIATSNTPVWSTGASLTGGVAPLTLDVSLAATEGADSITYSNVGALPAGISLASNGALTGTLNPGAETTYSFVVRATDAENQDANRTFSVTVTVPSNFIGQYSGGIVNVGFNTQGQFVPATVRAGNNLIVVAGAGATACTFGTTGEFATIVAHNKQGNVAWSKSFLTSYTSGLGIPTMSYGIYFQQKEVGNWDPAFMFTPRSVDVDSNDNVYYAFNSYHAEQNGGNGTYLYVTKLNSSGERQWINSIKNSYVSHVAASSVRLHNDTLYIAGQRGISSSYARSRTNLIGGDYASFLVSVNTASGAIINQFNLTIPQVRDFKFIPSTNNVVLVGTYYGYTAVGIANATPGNSSPSMYGWRQYSSIGGMYDKVEVATNGAIYCLGASQSNSTLSYLNIDGWVNPNLNSGAAATWRIGFNRASGSSSSTKWVAGDIKLKDDGFLYVTATDTAGSLSNEPSSYIFKINAANGNIEYQRRLTSNNIALDCTVTGLDIKGDNLVLPIIHNELTSADAFVGKGVLLLVPANGYSGSVNANVQFTIPGAQGANSKFVYSIGTFKTNANGFYSDNGDACTYSLAHISAPSNNFIGNTTANLVYDVLANTVHYDGDSTGGYYRAVSISNATSNVAQLTF